MPVKPLPNYETIPLRNENTIIAVAQTSYHTIDPSNPKKGIKYNLDSMIRFIDQIQRHKRDLIVFHEFPLQGQKFDWTRDEQIKVAVEVPGEETEIIGQKAKQYGCYIAFGVRARLKDWPGHFIYMGLLVGPDGGIVQQRWKLRNMAGIGFPTTVYDVLDRYVEMYGLDAIFPVARTDIGNIAFLPEIYEPEIARAFAIKGAEILIRYMTFGAGHWGTSPFVYKSALGDLMRIDLQACCIQNNVYGVFVNNAIVSEEVFEDFGSGRTAVYDMDGRLMAEAALHHETYIEAVVPMTYYRKNHSIPRIPKELYTHVLDDYESKYPPNTFLKSLPKSPQDSINHYSKYARW